MKFWTNITLNLILLEEKDDLKTRKIAQKKIAFCNTMSLGFTQPLEDGDREVARYSNSTELKSNILGATPIMMPKRKIITRYSCNSYTLKAEDLKIACEKWATV